MLMKRVQKLVSPDERAPQRLLAGAVPPDQRPFRQNGEESRNAAARRVESWEEKECMKEVKMIMQEQQGGKQETGQNDETG